MPIQLHELPVDLFPENLQFYIKRLNFELRQIAGLEGVLNNPVATNRSDGSIVRRATPQVDISRITPEPAMAVSVSGSTTTIGTPALTLGTANVVGSTTTVVSINSSIALFGTQAALGLSNVASVGTSSFAARADHLHRFPPQLQTDASGISVTVTDDGVDTTITNAKGNLFFSTPQAYSYRSTGSVATVAVIAGNPGSGTDNRTLLSPQWTGNNVSDATVRTWDCQPMPSGIISGLTIIGYDTSAFTVTPTSTSGSSNAGYCMRLSGPLIANGNANFTVLATALLEAPRRQITAVTSHTSVTALLECPTVGGTTQAGIIIKQRTAQQTATNRYAIFVEAQNSGTNRYAFYGVSDIFLHAGQIKHTGVQVGLYGATPTVQFGTSGTATGHSATTGTTVTHSDVFSGNTGTNSYTIGDIVRALKMIGALAY